MSKVYPLPEALDGAHWEIGEGAPSVTKTKSVSQMVVPLDHSEQSHIKRLREMAIAKHAPKSKRGVNKEVPEWLVTGIEHARTTIISAYETPPRTAKKMRDLGLHDEEVALTAATLARADDSMMTAAWVASTYMLPSDRAHVMEALFDVDQQVWRRVLSLSNIIDMMIPRYIEPHNYKNFKQSTARLANDLYDLLKEADDQEEQQQSDNSDEDVEESVNETASMIDTMKDYISQNHDEWGDLEVVDVPLNKATRSKLRAKRRRSSDRGVFPRNMHRYCTDKRIFSYSVRQPGGTVLLDLSGSMDWNQQMIEEILDLIPAGTVAGYSGWRQTAYLRILAKEGKIIDDPVLAEYWDTTKHAERARKEAQGKYGVYNVADGPALDWLAKQEGPRIWVSDGLVNGKKHHFTANLLADAAMKMRRHRIVRFEDLKDVKKYIEKFGYGRIK